MNLIGFIFTAVSSCGCVVVCVEIKLTNLKFCCRRLPFWTSRLNLAERSVQGNLFNFLTSRYFHYNHLNRAAILGCSLFSPYTPWSRQSRCSQSPRESDPSSGQCFSIAHISIFCFCHARACWKIWSRAGCWSREVGFVGRWQALSSAAAFGSMFLKWDKWRGSVSNDFLCFFCGGSCGGVLGGIYCWTTWKFWIRDWIRRLRLKKCS